MCEGGEALAHRTCGDLSLAVFKARWGSEQTGVMEDVPACGKGCCDYMISKVRFNPNHSDSVVCYIMLDFLGMFVEIKHALELPYMCAGNGSDGLKIMLVVRTEVLRGLDFAACAISDIVKGYSYKLHCCETHFSEKTPKTFI